MIQAAIDTSHGISLAIAEDGQLVASASAPYERRASEATLAPWIRERLREQGLSPSRVVKWTVGTGPGSFTGLRCGAAFVAGICMQSAARCRGLPSSLAVAMQTHDRHPERARILAVSDGRRGQLVVTGYRIEGGAVLADGEAHLLTPGRLSETLGDAVVGFVESKALRQLVSVLPEAALAGHGHVAAEKLLDPPGWEWPAEVELGKTPEPVYVRPPVFVDPAPSRPPPAYPRPGNRPRTCLRWKNRKL
jgi:tRNA threonylcarbamoyl adenosine modification protein YeaZ